MERSSEDINEFSSAEEVATFLFGPELQPTQSVKINPGENPSKDALTVGELARKAAEKLAQEQAVVTYRNTGETRIFDYTIGEWLRIVDPGEVRVPAAFIETGDENLDQEQTRAILDKPAETESTGMEHTVGYAIALGRALALQAQSVKDQANSNV